MCTLRVCVVHIHTRLTTNTEVSTKVARVYTQTILLQGLHKILCRITRLKVKYGFQLTSPEALEQKILEYNTELWKFTVLWSDRVNDYPFKKFSGFSFFGTL